MLWMLEQKMAGSFSSKSTNISSSTTSSSDTDGDSGKTEAEENGQADEKTVVNI